LILGSLYSGIGGLDVAAERALGARTAWQLDQVGAAVRRRHWPDALQVEADVQTVDPLALPRIGVLVGGFSCVDLSCAGRGDGLIDGERTGLTYREMVRFVVALQPEMVIMENVPALLSAWRVHLENDFGRLGYGLTWAPCMALDVGAPHRRARVFVVAVRGAVGRGVVEVPTAGRWTPEQDEQEWPTVRGTDGRRGGGSPERVRADRAGNDPDCLPTAVARAAGERTWATAKSSDARSPGESTGIGAREGTDGLACQVRPWPAPTEHGNNNALGLSPTSGDGLGTAVRPWPTPTARDHKTGEISDRVGTESLSQAASDYPRAPFGTRLNPAWVETLQGYPEGWTDTEGPRLECGPSPRWPRGRYPESWDRSVLWPGYDWEPPRTLPDGPPAKGRPARIRALGNAVVPQQGEMAIRAALAQSAQTDLWRTP